MKFKYGEFSNKQISEIKEKMRKKIFFLLLIVDPNTSEEYENIDILATFQNVLNTFGGLNDLLGYPQEFVDVISLVNAAFIEYKKPNFNWSMYRKFILDAGNAVLKIKEVDDANP